MISTEHPRIPGKRCSPKQADFIRRLARDSILNVVDLLARRGVASPEELSQGEARQIIDWCLDANRHAAEYPEEFGMPHQAKGRQTAEYQRYLQTAEWAQKRADFIWQAKGRCLRCGAMERLQVHHLHYETLGDEDFSDVEVLCPACHQGADRERVMDRRLEAWATARFGDDWRCDPGYTEAEEAFDEMLEREGNG